MMSDQPLESRIVNLETIADLLTRELTGEPGLVRLEPTVRSVMKHLKIASLNTLHQTLQQASPDLTVATRDGLILSMSDGVLNVHIDIATDLGHPALGLAERLQAKAAETVRHGGLTVGHIDVTILAIEGGTAHKC